MSHMGKPKGKVNAKLSLSQIKDAVAAALGTDVKFAPDCAEAADAAAALKPGEVLLLETSASILKRKASLLASTKKIQHTTQPRKK